MPRHVITECRGKMVLLAGPDLTHCSTLPHTDCTAGSATPPILLVVDSLLSK